MATKISISSGEAPVDIRVLQPNEKPHSRSIAPQSGYDFEVVGQAVIEIGGDATVKHAMPTATDELAGVEELGTPVPSDSGNQRPAPDAKPHAGSTSSTSELQPETDEVTAARERGELPTDSEVTGDTMETEDDVEAAHDPRRRTPRKR